MNKLRVFALVGGGGVLLLLLPAARVLVEGGLSLCSSSDVAFLDDKLNRLRGGEAGGDVGDTDVADTKGLCGGGLVLCGV